MYVLFQEDRQLASLYMLKRREGWHTTAPKIEKKINFMFSPQVMFQAK